MSGGPSSDSLNDLSPTTGRILANGRGNGGGSKRSSWGLGAGGMGPLVGNGQTYGAADAELSPLRTSPDGLGSGPGPGSGSGAGSGFSGRASTFAGGSEGGSGDGAGGKGRVETEAEAKRRKIQRACDVCRRKKIKCDGPMNSQSTSKCAHCHEYGKECTYVEAAKRRGPPKGYVEALEQRCGRLERLFQQLHPGVDLTEHIGPALDRDDFEQSTYLESLKSLHIPAYPQMKPLTAALSKSSSNTHAQPSPSSSISSPAAGPPSVASTVLGPAPWQTYERDPSRPPDDEEGNCGMDAAEHAQVAEAMNRLDIHDGSWRFHGKSSLAHLLRLFNTLKYKQDAGPTAFLERVAHIKRQEYWQVPEWEVVVANEGVRPVDYSIWPAPGFDRRLIDTYFDKVNTYLPLLNKIIFMRQYDAGSYKTSHGFAKVCLMVFANGARFVDDDERVFWPRDWAMSEEGKERLKSDADGTIRYSGGWIYMRAIMRMGRSIAQGPNLYDFQTQVLFCAFLQGAAVPHLMWVLSGLGLRSAQEIGIHVRSTLLLANPIERALYNRAFWCLYHIDRVNCAAIGRSVALQDTDFDADYPIPVDDEYWSTGDPEADFVQPERAGIPKVAAFVHMLKLDHVLGAALRTIYAINKLPEHHADTVSQRAVVVELDSALNAWADSVPDGLRWDPTRADQTLFEQSAMLYSQYYFCQILIHRPFIPTPAKLETIGLPSLAICSNAARSIANILDALLRRGRRFGALPGQAVNIHFLLPAWTAAVILLVSIYSAKQQKADRERAMLDVRRCIAATKEMEMTWRQAGKLTDVLTELASERGDGPDVPQAGYGPPPTVERGGGGKRAATDPEASAGMRSGSQSDLARKSSSASNKTRAHTGPSPSGSSSSTPARTHESFATPAAPPAGYTGHFAHRLPASGGASSATSGLPQSSYSRPVTPPNLWLATPAQAQLAHSDPILYGTAGTQGQNPIGRNCDGLIRPGGCGSQFDHHGTTGQSAQLPGFNLDQGIHGSENASPFNPFATPITNTQQSAPAQGQGQYQPTGYTPAPGFDFGGSGTGASGAAAGSGADYNPLAALDDMLWDASFLDALNPELFGMRDMSSGSGNGGGGMGGGMGRVGGAEGMGQDGAGGGGGDNVEDLWAQLFGVNNEGLWTPRLG